MNLIDAPARREIEAFLDVPIPAEISIHNVQFLDTEKLHGRVLERPDFFMLERAVQLGDSMLLSVVNMTVERCEGHFPGCPTVPLITLCDAMHQAGTALVSGHRKKSDEFPIAIQAGPSKALAKRLVRAPAKVLLTAELSETLRFLYVVNCRSYLDGKPIGSLEAVMYMLLPRRKLVC